MIISYDSIDPNRVTVWVGVSVRVRLMVRALIKCT